MMVPTIPLVFGDLAGGVETGEPSQPLGGPVRVRGFLDPVELGAGTELFGDVDEFLSRSKCLVGVCEMIDAVRSVYHSTVEPSTDPQRFGRIGHSLARPIPGW